MSYDALSNKMFWDLCNQYFKSSKKVIFKTKL